MIYYLFLDDERAPNGVPWVDLPDIPRNDWVIVRNIEDFKRTIDQHGIPKFVSFDNDLKREHYDNFLENNCADFEFEKFDDTGFNCAQYLVEKCLEQNKEVPDFECHSMNTVARAVIREYLRECRKIIKENLNIVKL